MKRLQAALLEHPLIRRYASLVREDMAATYVRDLRKWIVVAPILGVISGLLITVIAEIILHWIWPAILAFDLRHEVAIVPILAGGFLIAGLIMQYLTPNPDHHSTEEIISSYHEHQGRIDMRSFVPKLLSAIATVASGGSAALEGPSVYGGGALGSWLWTKFRFVGLEPRDRRILLISGAAAGMSAVFRAPLTGIVFALEMPYKDDLAHEALLPSLIASVVSYATMATFLGSAPLFDFITTSGYTRQDLLWAALLGLGCGLFVMTFNITFRRFRQFMVKLDVPHWVKMTAGGTLTGLCGLLFLAIYHGSLIPIGPNYEAVNSILRSTHTSSQLLVFGCLKLAATLFSLGAGGVSAMFVPLFLTGGAFGTAFGQSVVHTGTTELFAAVGMAAFIAAGYKTPLTAVVFVAEATGGHAFIIPSLIGAAVAYSVSGEASVSGDQRIHESVRVAELSEVTVADAMQRNTVQISSDASLLEFAQSLNEHAPRTVYPVCDAQRVVGLIQATALSRVPPAEWGRHRVADVMVRDVPHIPEDCDLQEALRTLMVRRDSQFLIVTDDDQQFEGILAPSDILATLDALGRGTLQPPHTSA